MQLRSSAFQLPAPATPLLAYAVRLTSSAATGSAGSLPLVRSNSLFLSTSARCAHASAACCSALSIFLNSCATSTISALCLLPTPMSTFHANKQGTKCQQGTGLSYCTTTRCARQKFSGKALSAFGTEMILPLPTGRVGKCLPTGQL